MKIFISPVNRAKLGDVALFTFEPHIGVGGSKFGYKTENVCFSDDGVKEL